MLRHKNLEVNHKTFCSTLLIPFIHFWHASHWITNSCSCLGQHSIGWSYSATFSLIIIPDDPGLNSIMLIKLYNCTWFNLFWNFALLHCIYILHSILYLFCLVFIVVVVIVLLEKVRLINFYSSRSGTLDGEITVKWKNLGTT